MALKTRIILGIAAGVALLLVAILPSRNCVEVDGESSLVAQASCGGWWEQGIRGHTASLRVARARLRHILGRRMLADTMRARLNSSSVVRSADGSIVVLYEQPLTADSARTWLGMIQRERDLAPGAGLRGRIVVALYTAPWRAPVDPVRISGAQYLGSRAVMRILNADPGDSTCYVRASLSAAGRSQFVTGNDADGKYSEIAGFCALVARFGRPGELVARQLVNVFNEGYSAYSNWAPEDLGSITRQLANQARHYRYPAYDYRAAACARGARQPCLDILGMGRQDYVYDYERNNHLRNFLLGLLARDPEAFAAMWRSPLPLERALTDAYRQPAAELVQAWARERFEVRDNGPILDRATVLGGIGWLVAALALALLLGRRRRVPA